MASRTRTAPARTAPARTPVPALAPTALSTRAGAPATRAGVTATVAGGPTQVERDALADQCNRVAHWLRRDLGERPDYPDGGPDRASAQVAKDLDACATDYVRTGKPGAQEVITGLVTQLRALPVQPDSAGVDQVAELVTALNA